MFTFCGIFILSGSCMPSQVVPWVSTTAARLVPSWALLRLTVLLLDLQNQVDGCLSCYAFGLDHHLRPISQNQGDGDVGSGNQACLKPRKIWGTMTHAGRVLSIKDGQELYWLLCMHTWWILIWGSGFLIADVYHHAAVRVKGIW